MDGGKISEQDRNRIMTCTDIRDGRVFKFNTNTIKNVRIGIGAPDSFDITTLNNKSMTLTSDMQYLKCAKGPKLKGVAK